MPITTQWINVERQFMPYKDEDDWELTYHAFGDGRYLGSQSWEQLLEYKRSVILAGAGAGKTAEMRERARLINDEGIKDAFYFPLNTLATRSLTKTLQTTDDAERYSAWQKSNREAVIFADSLDEARLNGHSFNEALSNLKAGLGEHAHRATILLSCRVSDWEDFQDLSEFETFLPSPRTKSALPKETEPIDADEALLAPLFKDNSSEEQQEPYSSSEDEGKPAHDTINIVGLAPLTRNQAKQIAEGCGTQEVDRFFSEVDSSGATSLATRPLDLLELIHYWEKFGAISSKTAALEWSLEQRLHEPTTEKKRKDQLSFDRAREGAKLVAAAMTFGQKRYIAWPFEGYKAAADDISLEPSKVLKDWTPVEQRLLMGRAVFDPASNGRVRFHNRETQEYLTSEWLLEQLSHGCSIPRLWHLLSQQKYGKVRIRPSLRPVTAWIAQKNARIREKVLAAAPEVLVEYGDPGNLPLAAKEHFLEKFAASYEGRNDAGISINIQQLGWLAQPELASKIQKLWENSHQSGETRELLLRLIWIGKIEACSDIALSAATQRNRSYQISLGARALAEIGSTHEQEKLLAHLIKHRRSYPSRAIEPALRCVRPVLSSAQLLKLISDFPRSSERVVHSGIVYALGELFREFGCDEPDVVIAGMWKLLKKKPTTAHEKRSYSLKYRHLKAPLLELIAWHIGQLKHAPLNSETAVICRDLSIMTRHAGDYEISDPFKRLCEALSANPGSNRQQFFLSVDDALKDKFGPWVFLRGEAFSAAWKLGEKDFQWLLADLRKDQITKERECILNGTFGVWFRSGEKDDALTEIRTAIADSDVLVSALNDLIDPPPVEPPEWEKKHAREMENIKRKRDIRTREAKDSWIAFRNRLKDNPDQLREQAQFGDLYDLTRWLKRKCGHDVEEYADYQKLEDAFGSDVPSAARDAFINFWRSYDPTTLLYRSKLTNRCDLGRLGIEIEARETPNWAQSLNLEDIRLATAYLMLDIGGISETANRLWTTRADEVAEQIVQVFRREFRRKPDDNRIRFLDGFAQAPEPLRSITSKWLIALLHQEQPLSARCLENAVRVIAFADELDRNSLLSTAQKWFHKSRKRYHRIRWLAVWIGIDSDSALSALESWLRSQRKQADRDELIISLLTFMFDSHSYQLGPHLQEFRRVPSLKKLIVLAYQHVRRNEDNHHEGSYTPNHRDHAEGARSYLVGMLLNIPGEATVRTLLELRNEREFEWSNERFEVLADERATRDADLEPWSPEDILSFMRSHELNPGNVAELFLVVEDRLDDIRDDIENGQFSNKQALRQDHVDWPTRKHDERVIQLALARELNSRRGSVYSNVREEEQEDRNEPDISIHRPGLPHHIPIEIKIADSWTYNELEATIRDQIIEKYLKPAAATHGFLVVTYHGKKTYWQARKGEPRLTFKELIHNLHQAALKICEKIENVEAIEVVGIDLSG
ncbi:hypothetical protein [Salaquimonas pukyongi]|uniref:hypothetical protein n=1 Tax=Salaquimonas pukyongi TaxID=2712698 RepID=UPI00096B99B7|nr:hypothetical protein [Salaquimonas pukyongi]